MSTSTSGYSTTRYVPDFDQTGPRKQALISAYASKGALPRMACDYEALKVFGLLEENPSLLSKKYTMLRLTLHPLRLENLELVSELGHRLYELHEVMDLTADSEHCVNSLLCCIADHPTRRWNSDKEREIDKAWSLGMCPDVLHHWLSSQIESRRMDCLDLDRAKPLQSRLHASCPSLPSNRDRTVYGYHALNTPHPLCKDLAPDQTILQLIELTTVDISWGAKGETISDRIQMVDHRKDPIATITQKLESKDCSSMCMGSVVSTGGCVQKRTGETKASDLPLCCSEHDVITQDCSLACRVDKLRVGRQSTGPPVPEIQLNGRKLRPGPLCWEVEQSEFMPTLREANRGRSPVRRGSFSSSWSSWSPPGTVIG